MDKIYEEVHDYASSIAVIDTHEHLPPRESEREQKTDVLREYLTHYFDRDLISAGLTIGDYEKVIDHSLPLKERWTLVEPYWDMCRYTGYGQSLQRSVKGLYGIEEISGKTIEKLNDFFQDGLDTENHFNYVLREKSGIEKSLIIVREQDLSHDEELFEAVYQIDHLIAPKNEDQINRVQQDSGIDITSFEDWLEAGEFLMRDALAHGAVAFKSGLAYERSLFYDQTTRHEAEKGFLNSFRIIRNQPDGSKPVFLVGKAFQDYMMHFILRFAHRNRVAVQFHTGLQEGSGNMVSNSHPVLLTNLILQYRKVKFDLFHIGYPYQHVMGTLAKNNPNVYIDMCWAHMISPSVCKQALAEWIDTVPLNKISAFGGDYAFVDGVYGHLQMARENVSSVLADKVREGLFPMEKAKEVAKLFFFDNPYRLFNLEAANRQTGNTQGRKS